MSVPSPGARRPMIAAVATLLGDGLVVLFVVAM